MGTRPAHALCLMSSSESVATPGYETQDRNFGRHNELACGTVSLNAAVPVAASIMAAFTAAAVRQTAHPCPKMNEQRKCLAQARNDAIDPERTSS